MTERSFGKWAWRLGQIVQGVGMGVLLFHAVLSLITVAGHITAFRYEGY
ncbi:MAG TPA: hypothetical protein VF440_04940 [Novosphingobium sp.]